MRKDTKHELDKARESGHQAYFDGHEKDANPFCGETQIEWFEEWEAGWLRADSDSDNG
jgi:ribosome modulation factor